MKKRQKKGKEKKQYKYDIVQMNYQKQMEDGLAPFNGNSFINLFPLSQLSADPKKSRLSSLANQRFADLNELSVSAPSPHSTDDVQNELMLQKKNTRGKKQRQSDRNQSYFQYIAIITILLFFIWLGNRWYKRWQERQLDFEQWEKFLQNDK